jgi:hypothetical protein
MLMRLPVLFWELTLTEKVDCMEGHSIKGILTVTGFQCFINMAME